MERNIQAIFQSEPFQRAADFLQRDARLTVEQQLELVQIPAFSNHEEERARHFKRMIEAEGYTAHMDEVCNVYTSIQGTGDGPTVYLSAHLDTVFPMDTPLQPRWEGSRIYCPGICDDTRGLAEVLSFLRAFRETGVKPVGNLILGGNVGEEGLGNLRGMRHFFQRNADQVDGFFSLDGANPSYVYGGTGSIRYKVVFRGPGGHSYGDYGCVNPIHAMGRAICRISELRTPELPKTTFSVGVVEGGTSVNSIAYECSMLVDMRSDEQEPLMKLHEEVLACIQAAVEEENSRWTEERKWNKNMFGRTYDPEARIQVELQKVGDRPGGSQSPESPIVQITAASYRALGFSPEGVAHSSTDANIAFSLQIPACAVTCGGTSGNNHSLDEWYDTEEAYKGPQRTLLMLLGCVGLDGVSQPLLPRRNR